MGVYSGYICGLPPGLGRGLLCLAISMVYLPWSRWALLCLAISVVYLPWSGGGGTLFGYICSLPTLV